jgi:large subunit ribosomal protein L7/L12
MSTITNEIIEQLKSLTLWEASELVSQIEQTFGVNASAQMSSGVSIIPNQAQAVEQKVVEEKTIFDVVVETVAADKRVSVLKVIRKLTSLGLTEAKDFTTSLPKALLQSVSKENAASAKQQLEEAGATVKII